MNDVFKALSDPTRREILRILSRGEQSAGALAEPFEVTKPSMSHHFAVLREAGLIRSRREGQQVIYSLDTTVVEDVLARIWDLFGAARERGGDRDDAWILDGGIGDRDCGLGRDPGAVSGPPGEDPEPLGHPR